MLLVGLLDGEILHLLRSILRSEVFLVIEAEIIGFSDFTVPVLVDQVLEVDSSLLANLALEVLVHLLINCGVSIGQIRDFSDYPKIARNWRQI